METVITIEKKVQDTFTSESVNKTIKVLGARGEEIKDVVTHYISEVLGIEKGTIRTDASLMEELGAESIDFLDLVFRLESHFSIKIPRGGIKTSSMKGLNESEFEVDGVLTPLGLARLKSVMPEVDQSKFKEGLRTKEIPRLFTAQTFINFVAWRLAEEHPSVNN